MSRILVWSQDTYFTKLVLTGPFRKKNLRGLLTFSITQQRLILRLYQAVFQVGNHSMLAFPIQYMCNFNLSAHVAGCKNKVDDNSVLGFKKEEVKVLPSCLTITTLHDNYTKACTENGVVACGITTFCNAWLEVLPFLFISKSSTDLCCTCHRNNTYVSS